MKNLIIKCAYVKENPLKLLNEILKAKLSLNGEKLCVGESRRGIFLSFAKKPFLKSLKLWLLTEPIF